MQDDVIKKAFEEYYRDRYAKDTKDSEFCAILLHCWQACDAQVRWENQMLRKRLKDAGLSI